MIESLKGILNKKDPTQVIIDVGVVRLGVVKVCIKIQARVGIGIGM